jgi:ankyrin repeat protein
MLAFDLTRAETMGDTPLRTACLHGNTAQAIRLIESNADLETPTWFLSTPLHAASVGGHCDIIAALVQANVELEATDSLGETALCHASKYSSAAVRFLIKSCASVDHRASYGHTPLFFACNAGRRGNLPALKVLLAAGADRTGLQNYGYSAAITQTLADAAAPWSPGRHFLRGFPARSAIKTLLLVGLRRYLPAWPVVMIHIN